MDVFFQKLFLPVLLRYGRVDLMRGYVKPLRTEQRAPICLSPGFSPLKPQMRAFGLNQKLVSGLTLYNKQTISKKKIDNQKKKIAGKNKTKYCQL